MGKKKSFSFKVTKETAVSMNIYLVLLADTHGFHRRLIILDGDIVIFAGDFYLYGDLSELDGFNAFLGRLPHQYKIVVAGNHDYVALSFSRLFAKIV
jgi:predicted phosphohydrolase